MGAPWRFVLFTAYGPWEATWRHHALDEMLVEILDEPEWCPDMFNTYKIPPEPRYYYSGPDAAAFAFIGVHKEYTLESRFWKPVDLSPALLQTWLNFRSAQRKDISVNLYGANILGPNDEQIGYWYSVRDWRDVGAVKMGEGNSVYITTPRGNTRRKDTD